MYNRERKQQQFKQMIKRDSDELQEYLQFKRRGSRVPSKRGKGSYTRKIKHKETSFEIF